MHRLRAFFTACALVLAILTTPAWAANKIYTVPETALTFGDAAQTPSAQLTLTSLAAGAGRMSALFNRGATAHAAWYKWRARISLNGSHTVGEAIEIYLGTSDGTNPDGQLSTDSALASDKRRNLLLLGVLQVDQTTNNTTMTASGLVYVVDQHLAIGVWNGTAIPFEASTAKHRVTLTPWPQEIQ